MENIKHDIPLPLALYRAPEGPEVNSEKVGVKYALIHCKPCWNV
jgi:hypothetical protein